MSGEVEIPRGWMRVPVGDVIQKGDKLWEVDAGCWQSRTYVSIGTTVKRWYAPTIRKKPRYRLDVTDT